MPAGQVIGRVSIKVLPDTDDFRRDAQRDLDRIEKQLKIEVPTKIDMSGASRELLEEIRKINQRNRAMDSRKIRLYTKISTDGMREELSKAVRNYQTRAQNEKIKIDTELVAGQFAAELDKQSLDHVQQQLDHFRRKNDPIKLKVEADWASAKGLEVDAHIAVLTRPRTVSIIPTMNDAAYAKVATALAALSGARVLNDLLDGLWTRLKRLDQAVPIIGSLALAIAGLAGWGITAVSNLFALSVALAQIGPAALALPGILGGIAIGVGTMIAAFKDFNTIFPDVKAKLSELQNIISANFWDKAKAPFREMIDDIFPRLKAGLGEVSTQLGGFFGNLARSLTTILGPQLDSMFSGLSKSIDVFSEHTNSIVGIITTLGQVGTNYLPKLASYVGDLADRFNSFLAAADADGRLQSWIDRALQGMRDLGSATGDFFGILAGIGRAATAAGGASLGMFADTMERVRNVVDSPGFQTGLTNLFRSAHQAMSQIAQQSGPAVETLFTNIAGLLTEILPQVGNTLGILIRAVAQMASSTPVMDGFRAIFSGLETAVRALEPAFAALGPALGAIGTIIGTLAPVIARLVTAAIVPLSAAFVALTPLINTIIKALGEGLLQVITAITPTFNQLVPVIRDALTQAFTKLAPLIPVVAKAFGDILIALAPLIPQVVALIPPLATLIAAVLPPLIAAIVRLVQVIVPVITVIAQLINLLMPVLVPALTFLAKVLIDTVMFAVNSVVRVFEGFKNVLQGVINFITGVFTGNWSKAWDGIKQLLLGVLQVIVGAIGVFLSVGVIGAFSKGLVALRALWKGGLDAILAIGKALCSDMLSAFRSFLSAFSASPSAALSAMKGLFADAWAAIKGAAGLAFDALKSTVKSKLSEVLSFVKSLPGDCRSALGDLSGTLKDAGIQLIKGFIDGIGGMFGAVKGKLGDLTSKLTSWKGPESLDRVLLVNAGQLIIEGFVKGLESRYDAVRKSLQGLTADVSGTHINAPELGSMAGQLALAVTGSMADGGSSGGDKHLHYYAASGSSLGSEEDLFEAANRARMVGW